MALIRREPQRAWPQSFENSLDWAFRPFENWRRAAEEEHVNVEEFVENDQLVVRAVLPGVDPDNDIAVSIVDGNLHIRAERRQDTETQDRDYRRTEIRYGSFSRILPLPANTKEDDIEASYKDGILEVRAPVRIGVGQPSQVPIKRS